MIDAITCGVDKQNYLLSNDAELYDKMFQISPNHEACHEKIDCFRQNQEAHQGKIHCFHQNQEARQGKIDCFHQNQEAHQITMLEVVESQHGGSYYDESQHGGSLLTSGQVSWIEGQASRLLAQGDFSILSLEKFISQFPNVQAKQRMRTMHGCYLTFGLYAYGNQHGLTGRSRELPFFVKYVNALLKFQGKGRIADDATWTTFVLGIDAGANPHRDRHNRLGSSDYVLGCGKYQNGEVWQQRPHPSKAHTEWKAEWSESSCPQAECQEQSVRARPEAMAWFRRLDRHSLSVECFYFKKL